MSEPSIAVRMIYFADYPQCKNCRGNPPSTPECEKVDKIGCMRDVNQCRDREKSLCPKCPRNGRTTLEAFA